MEKNCAYAIRLTNVCKSFGGLQAVKNVNMTVKKGERKLLIGTNGAGKTTLFNMIAGDFPATSGEIEVFGQNVNKLSMVQRTRLGLKRTYQTSSLFNELTVRQNLYLAVLGEKPMRQQMHLFKLWNSNKADQARIEKAAKDIGFDDRLDTRVESLSHGERRQLELGLALICNPKILLLDEPAAGLSADERKTLVKLIQALPADMTVVMVEHDFALALSVADSITVMFDGEIVAEGDPDSIKNNETVRSIYLGGVQSDNANP